MYPGLPSRLEREIKQLYLENVLKVRRLSFSHAALTLRTGRHIKTVQVQDPHRGPAAPQAHGSCIDHSARCLNHLHNQVFLGGAVLANVMKDRSEFWISREEYEEQGIDNCLKKLGA